MLYGYSRGTLGRGAVHPREVVLESGGLREHVEEVDHDALGYTSEYSQFSEYPTEH